MTHSSTKLSLWVACLCVTALVIVFAMTAFAAATLVNDSFDKDATGSLPSGYTSDPTGGKVAVAEIPSATNKSIFINAADKGSKVIRKFDPQKGLVSIEVSFMQPALGNATVLQIMDQEGKNTAMVFELQAGSINYKSITGGFKQYAAYKENQWVTIKVLADTPKQRGNIWIDNVAVDYNQPYVGGVSNIGSIVASTMESGAKSLYLDNIKVASVDEASNDPNKFAWERVLDMKPEWYGTKEAADIADKILLYQRNDGSFHKNTDMSVPLSDKDLAGLMKEKPQQDGTIDNDGTTTEMIYFARVYKFTKNDKYKEGFIKALDWLLKAQYPNGGWPQYYPDKSLYRAHITYNDDAMIHVMIMMREIGQNKDLYGFIDSARVAQAKQAYDKGIECILNTQIKVNGQLTAWCAQHDEKTLAPANARAYELASISGKESVGIVRFLMAIDKPNPAIINSIQSAVAWLNQVKIYGIEAIQKQDPTQPKGWDRVVVQNPKALPIWGRFYEIGTNKPIFVGRDGIVKYNLSEIEYERRVGYGYYVYEPATLLSDDYPVWQAKWDPSHNVLKK